MKRITVNFATGNNGCELSGLRHSMSITIALHCKQKWQDGTRNTKSKKCELTESGSKNAGKNIEQQTKYIDKRKSAEKCSDSTEKKE